MIIIIFLIAEVMEKSVYHSSNGRAAAYAVPPVGGIKYTAYNETVTNLSGVQGVPFTELGAQPIQCTCGKCRSFIVTRVQQTPGSFVWFLCCILIIFGCWLGCCYIPFCIRSIQNTQHFCPNCNAFIGQYRPL
jgi:lipopolysaccharide-induced tumor necrosis factor-alpha factor